MVDRAQSLLDVYGMERDDSPLGKVRCPFLAILGTNEPAIGAPEDLETLKRNARASSRADTALIEGANHLLPRPRGGGREGDLRVARAAAVSHRPRGRDAMKATMNGGAR